MSRDTSSAPSTLAGLTAAPNSTADFDALRCIGATLIAHIGAHAERYPDQADALMTQLLKGAQGWFSLEKKEIVQAWHKPVRIIVAEPPPAEASPTPAADAARTRWETAIFALLEARIGLYAADEQHACLMDLRLIRLLAGVGAVTA